MCHTYPWHLTSWTISDPLFYLPAAVSCIPQPRCQHHITPYTALHYTTLHYTTPLINPFLSLPPLHQVYEQFMGVPSSRLIDTCGDIDPDPRRANDCGINPVIEKLMTQVPNRTMIGK